MVCSKSGRVGDVKIDDVIQEFVDVSNNQPTKYNRPGREPSGQGTTRQSV